MRLSAHISSVLAVCVTVLLSLAAPASASVIGPQFAAAPYGRADIQASPAETVVRVTDRPGGVSYVASLDPTKTYRVRLRGRTERNGMVLRWRMDDRYVYERAPNGLSTLRVHDTSERGPDLPPLRRRRRGLPPARLGIEDATAPPTPTCAPWWSASVPRSRNCSPAATATAPRSSHALGRPAPARGRRRPAAAHQHGPLQRGEALLDQFATAEPASTAAACRTSSNKLLALFGSRPTGSTSATRRSTPTPRS